MQRTPAPMRALAALLAAAAASGLATGCATPTAYQPAEIGASNDVGYSDQRLAEGRYRVSFAGNRMTSRETVEDYLLYRAAELTREKGYDGFLLVERDTERDVETRVDNYGPGPFSYWGPSWRFYRSRIGWAYWDPYFGDPFWNNSVNVRNVESYEAFAEIAMFNGTRPDDLRAFDAADVLESLGPRIKRPERS